MVNWLTDAVGGRFTATDVGFEPDAGFSICRFARLSISSIVIVMLSGVAGICNFVVPASEDVTLDIWMLVAPFARAVFAAANDPTLVTISLLSGPAKFLSTVILIFAGLVKRSPTMFVR